MELELNSGINNSKPLYHQYIQIYNPWYSYGITHLVSEQTCSCLT